MWNGGEKQLRKSVVLGKKFSETEDRACFSSLFRNRGASNVLSDNVFQKSGNRTRNNSVQGGIYSASFAEDISAVPKANDELNKFWQTKQHECSCLEKGVRNYTIVDKIGLLAYVPECQLSQKNCTNESNMHIPSRYRGYVTAKKFIIRSSAEFDPTDNDSSNVIPMHGYMCNDFVDEIGQRITEIEMTEQGEERGENPRNISEIPGVTTHSYLVTNYDGKMQNEVEFIFTQFQNLIQSDEWRKLLAIITTFDTEEEKEKHRKTILISVRQHLQEILNEIIGWKAEKMQVVERLAAKNYPMQHAYLILKRIKSRFPLNISVNNDGMLELDITLPRRARDDVFTEELVGVVMSPLTSSTLGTIYFKDEIFYRLDGCRFSTASFGFNQLRKTIQEKIALPHNCGNDYPIFESGHVLIFKMQRIGRTQPIFCFSDFRPIGMSSLSFINCSRFRGVLIRLFRHLGVGYIYSPVHQMHFKVNVHNHMELRAHAPIRLGDSVDFNVISDSGQLRVDADTVAILPGGCLKDCYLEDEKYKRGIIQTPASKNQYGTVTIKLINEQGDEEVQKYPFYYNHSDYDQSSVAQVGYYVSFRILHDKDSERDVYGNGIAVNVKIENGLVRHMGYISALYDGFGFIEKDQKDSVWFHFSRVADDQNPNELYIGDLVSFSILPANLHKPTLQGCWVKKEEDRETFSYDEILLKGIFYSGIVVKSLRCDNNVSNDYRGIIKISSVESDLEESMETQKYLNRNAFFALSNQADKSEKLFVGDYVRFQLGRSNEAGEETQAVGIKRKYFRVKVRNTFPRSKFGFLDFANQDLFFHINFVSGQKDLQAGDLVECLVRKDIHLRPCAQDVRLIMKRNDAKFLKPKNLGNGQHRHDFEIAKEVFGFAKPKEYPCSSTHQSLESAGPSFDSKACDGASNAAAGASQSECGLGDV